jgi:beta-lactamase class A
MDHLAASRPAVTPGNVAGPLADLARPLADLATAAPGHVSVVVADRNGVLVDVDGSRVVPAASTVKVPILVAVLRQMARGEVGLDDPVRLGDRRVGGSGPLSALVSVTHLPVGELLDLMITLSDNDATNALLDLVGLAVVDSLCREVGMVDTSVRRRLMDPQAVLEGRDNSTSAADLARVLVLLREGRLLPPAGTTLALEVLAQQQFLDGLPALLPQGVWHGNKTGELHGVRHDMMLVGAGGSWASVAVTATGLADDVTGADRGSLVLPTFARIGELVASRLHDTADSFA